MVLYDIRGFITLDEMKEISSKILFDLKLNYPISRIIIIISYQALEYFNTFKMSLNTSIPHIPV